MPMISLSRLLSSKNKDEKAAEDLLKKGTITLAKTWKQYTWLDEYASSLITYGVWPSLSDLDLSWVEDEEIKTRIVSYANNYKRIVEMLQHETLGLDTLVGFLNQARERIPPGNLNTRLQTMARNANLTARELELLPHQQYPKKWEKQEFTLYRRELALKWLQQKRANIQAKSGILYIEVDGRLPVPEVQHDSVDSSPLPDPLEWKEQKEQIQTYPETQDDPVYSLPLPDPFEWEEKREQIQTYPERQHGNTQYWFPSSHEEEERTERATQKEAERAARQAARAAARAGATQAARRASRRAARLAEYEKQEESRWYLERQGGASSSNFLEYLPASAEPKQYARPYGTKPSFSPSSSISNESTSTSSSSDEPEHQPFHHPQAFEHHGHYFYNRPSRKSARYPLHMNQHQSEEGINSSGDYDGEISDAFHNFHLY